jgi:hypothetical protein
MLAPRWSQLKIGHLLRGEIDHRFYYDLFRRRENDVNGLKKTWLRAFAVDVKEPGEDPTAASDTTKDVIVTFEGPGGHFERLNGWSEYLMQELRAITRERWLDVVDEFGEVPLAVHVRRGDFALAATEDELFTRGGIRTPTVWFTRCLDTIRSAVDARVRTVIVSDGTDWDLRDLLTRTDVELVRTGSAIADLLLLSNARVLIGSGGSTFTAWASFLGQMPTVTVPGQSLRWFNLRHQNGSFVGEFDPDHPDITFLNQCRQKLNARSTDPPVRVQSRVSGGAW